MNVTAFAALNWRERNTDKGSIGLDRFASTAMNNGVNRPAAARLARTNGFSHPRFGPVISP